MTPGLAIFYGGMVRRKNVLAMLMQNFATMAVVGLAWAWFSYSLAFGPDWGGLGLLGDFHFVALSGTSGAIPGMAHQTIPQLAFVAFQMMFAVITAALLTGSSADRLSFGAFCIFVLVWSVVVYDPIAHWVFSPEGWLAKSGTEDFAGGTVVEVTSGVSGAALALVVGPRRGWPRELMRPHNVPLSVLGAGILWFGWFGFNAGSALSAGRAVEAFVNTNTATAAALLAWLAVEKLRDGRPTTLGAASGAVAGAVGITPACGYVNTVGATVIGLAAGAACALAVSLKFKLGVDDSLDVLAVHGVGGFVGMLMVGFFGASAVGGANGLFYGGGAGLLGRQALAVAVTAGWAFCGTAAVAWVVHRLVGMRVGPEEELAGLDVSLHEESAYDFEALGSSRLWPSAPQPTRRRLEKD